MRKTPDLERFPYSAALFRFCFAVYEIHHGQKSKVHDQNVGDLLAYNPSDTSHWKRGKKAVRSIYELSSIAKQLNVDFDIIEGIALGQLDFEEAWFEFLENEELRKTLQQQVTPNFHYVRRERQKVFEQAAQAILTQANVSSVPVYLPEVLSLFPFIQLSQGEISDRLVRTTRIKPGQYNIRYRKGELRAHTRAALAREIGRVLLHAELRSYSFPERKEAFGFSDVVDFSNALLVPQASLRIEMQKTLSKANLIKALADVFWVPKSIIRLRMADLLLKNADAQVFSLPNIIEPSYAADRALELTSLFSTSSSLESRTR